MAGGPLFHDRYTPHFSGHETFPLRYGWLKKVYDRVEDTENNGENKTLCWDRDAIARFGVGKNMVASMRHWAKATGIIVEPDTNNVKTEPLGRLLLCKSGLDPYMEQPATLWLVHWQLAADPDRTTWFWAFSHFPATTFERDIFVSMLDRFAKARNWSRVANTTIRNDVACFIRTYAAGSPLGRSVHDDVLESPLTELGLIKAVSKNNLFRFVRGPKSTLGDGVFAYAIIDFWRRYSPEAATLAFEAIAFAPGSPGRVFCLDENDVADRLVALGDTTGGALQWSETAGLKQVVRAIDLSAANELDWLSVDYCVTGTRDAAKCL